MSRARLTRDRIVEVATALVESDGYDAVSTRRIAAELGVTAPALYDHVESKGELLRVVAAHGFGLLSASWRSDGGRAIDRARGRARAYVDFARDHPQLFQLMFTYRPAGVPFEVDNELAAATDLFDEATADLRLAVEDGDLVDRDPQRLALTLWVAVHGVAVLGTSVPGLAGDLADDVIDALFAGLRPA